MKGKGFKTLLFLVIQEPSLVFEMDQVMLIKTPPPVSIKLLPTNVTKKTGVLFDVLIPNVDTIIGLVSSAAALVLEPLITFATLIRHHI